MRQDLETLALASYFAEVAEASAQEGETCPELLSLLLNCLYALDTLKKPRALVKAVFELRLLCLTGYEPLLDACAAVSYTHLDVYKRQVYTFDEGMTVTWQRFFSPDGTKLVFPWKTDLGSPQWRIRVVDLSTGGETDLDIPEWEGETEVLLVKWQDDTTLQATACQFTSSAAGRMASWTYAVPR